MTDRAENPATHMRLRVTKRLALAAAAAIGIALLAWGWVRAHPADRIEVSTPYMVNFTSDMTPVETRLYHYRGNEGARNDYRVIGAPLRFAFPSTYYLYRENQRGGAQGRITLAVDRATLTPIARLIADAGHDRLSDPIGLHYKNYSLRDLTIMVTSNYASNFPFRGISQPQARHFFPLVGSACGMVFYRSSVPDPGSQPPLMLGKIDLNSHEYYGESTGAGPWRGLRCARLSPNCRISFDYHGFQASFFVEKRNFCGFEGEISRVSALLDRFNLDLAK